MLVACWSVKGGSGTTVVSAAIALLLARRSARVVLVDVAGDVPVALGLPESTGPGLGDWLASWPDVAPDALQRLEIDVPRTKLAVLPRGELAPVVANDAASRLAAELASDIDRITVVDCGPIDTDPAATLAASAGLSLLVLRPCYLALRRALAAPIRPSGVILVEEPDRALRASDIEDVLGVPVRATVPWDSSISRAVDAGLLGSRVPRRLERALRDAA